MSSACVSDYLTPAMRYAADGMAEEAARAFYAPMPWGRAAAPTAQELEQILYAAGDVRGSFSAGLGEDTARRLVHMAYALAATLPGTPLLCFPAAPGPLMQRLYRSREALHELEEILSQLEALRLTCSVFPQGSFRLTKACGGVLHFQRISETETLDAVFNRTGHLFVESIGEKSTEINAFGFTITVQDNGHSPDHSYYDIV
jgi:hypothetical protein